MRSFLLFPVVSIACALAGCTFHSSETTASKPPPSSDTLATSEMWPSMSAQTDGQTVKVYAALLKGSDFVLLADGEYFTATFAGQSIVLKREPYVDGKIHYFATFAAPTTASDVVIAFHRISGKSEAAQSATTIPAAFAITSAAPPSFKIGTTLNIAISPPPITKTDGTDFMSVAYNGDCIADSNPQPVTFDVEGVAKVDTSKIVLKKGASGCDVGVQVRHETRGKADAAYSQPDAHPVEGLQARSFNTSLVP